MSQSHDKFLADTNYGNLTSHNQEICLILPASRNTISLEPVLGCGVLGFNETQREVTEKQNTLIRGLTQTH
jgi:hypothetical protein